ncbi:MAG: hypothetical protein BM556_02610 [Bacteriovorax sp. MedPE-SWde]|nr:MAG: hypothetical protein BM556_02610 [Bacteriovorax sp. MedPE-SWde]
METIEILLAEDDQDIRELIEYDILKIFGKENCKVDLASNGSQAIGLLNQNKYDVILSDYHLPDFSGAQVRKSLKTETPFIYISGDISIIGDCDNKSIFALEKPFKTEDLQEILKRTVQTTKIQ